MNTTQIANRGITLLEVLLALGILAIGLSSILALLPAAASISRDAIIVENANTIAENALAHALTAGFCRAQSLNRSIYANNLEAETQLQEMWPRFHPYFSHAGNVSWQTLFISPREVGGFEPETFAFASPALDERNAWWFCIPSTSAGLTNRPKKAMGDKYYGLVAAPKRRGLLANILDAEPVEPLTWRMNTSSRDDLITTSPSDGGLPQEVIIDGVRASQGDFSVVYALSRTARQSSHFAAGTAAWLTAIVFYKQRSQSLDGLVIGNVPELFGEQFQDDYGPLIKPIVIPASRLPDGESPKKVLRPGGVLFCPWGEGVGRFRQIDGAFFLGDGSALMTRYSGQMDDGYLITTTGPMEDRFNRDAPTNAPAYLFLGSVAIAHRLITIEGNGSVYPISRDD